MRSIKYELFKIWKKQQYKKFLKEQNWDFDHSSITQFLDLKLTIMGLYFAKFGIVVDEDRKQQVHTIWQTRKYLRNYENAFDITYEQCQKQFREKYGTDYKYEFEYKQNTNKTFSVTGKMISDVVNREEAELYWKSLKHWDREEAFIQENLKKVFVNLNTHMRTWWD